MGRGRTGSISMTAATLLTVEQVPIDLLRPDPANPRRISEEELDALERSIREWGFVQPVLARRDDRTVIGGHQRLVAARRLGLTTVPVTWLDLSVEQARQLNLALNKITGSWDEQLLARLLADLQTSVDLTLSGFGKDEIADLLRSLETREKAERPEDLDLDSALEEAARELPAGAIAGGSGPRSGCAGAIRRTPQVRGRPSAQPAQPGRCARPSQPGHPLLASCRGSTSRLDASRSPWQW